MSASIPTTEFQHEPLPNRTWIRLIRIHPDLEYGNLVCTLEHFGPKSRPPYVALSYCWGDPTPRHTVHINGLVRKVHENLWRFLHRAWMNKETDWFWTDSICIDQAHHSELNDQVTRMGNIYSQADHVISWLGECPRGVEALQTIMNWGPGLPYHLDPKSTADRLSPRSISLRRALLRLLREEQYWRRVWVIQEVACARTTLVVYGSVAVDFDVLSKQLASAWAKFPWKDGIIEADAWTSHWVFKLVKLRDHMKAGKYLRFSGLIREFSNCDSTRQLDRVYGLLGLADRLDPYFDPVGLEVNYDKTLEEVFWDIVFLTAGNMALETGSDLFSTVSVPHGVRSIKDDVGSRLCSYANADTTSGRRKVRARQAANMYEAIMAGLRVTSWVSSDIDDDPADAISGEGQSVNKRLRLVDAVKEAVSHACQHILCNALAGNRATQGALLGIALAAHNLLEPSSNRKNMASSLPESPAWVYAPRYVDSQLCDRKVISTFADNCQFRNPIVERYGQATLAIPELWTLVQTKQLERHGKSVATFYCMLCSAESPASEGQRETSRDNALDQPDMLAQVGRVMTALLQARRRSRPDVKSEAGEATKPTLRRMPSLRLDEQE